LRSSDTDAGLDGGIISFIFVAFGDDVALDTIAVIISVVAEIALTGNSVEGFVGSTSSAGAQDPEIAIIAVTLTVLKITIDSTVLIAAAFSIDDSVTSITDTALSSLVPVGVEGTLFRVDAFAVIDGHAVGTHASSVDVGSINGANWLTVAVILFVSRFAETSVRV